MSEVIRDVTIRLKLEQQKAKLESPELTKVTQAYQEQAKAAKEVRSQAEANQRQIQETSRVAVNSNLRVAASFREAGEGALRFARGLAFLSASGSQDLQKLVQSVAIAHGALDLFAGGLKVITNLAQALSPVGRAVAVIGGALVAGGVAWRKYKDDATEALKAVGDSAQREQKRLMELGAAQQRLAAGVADVRIQAGLTEVEQDRRRDQERQRLAVEGDDIYRRAFVATGGQRDNVSRYFLGIGRFQEGAEVGPIKSEFSVRPEAVREQLRIEEQLRDNLQRRVDLERDFYRRQTEALNRQFAGTMAGINIAATNPLGLGGLAAGGFNQLLGEAERDAVRRQEQLQHALDQIVKAFEESATRVTKAGSVIRDLERAHDK